MMPDLDPRETWNHEASLASRATANGDRSPRTPGSRPTKADGKGQDVGIDGVADLAIDDVVDGYTANDKEDEPPTPPPRTPSPLPPFGSPFGEDSRTLAERRMLIDPPLLPLNTVFTSPPNAQGLQPSATADGGTQTTFMHSFHPSTSPTTPTPTTADFRLMLKSYSEIPEEEISRLSEMADRVAEHRVKMAREEEKQKFLSAPGTPTTGSAFLSPARTAPFTRSAMSLDASGMLTPIPSPGAALSSGARTKGVERMRTAGLNLRILQHLLPAKILLTQSAAADELPSLGQTRAAAGYAYVALSHARSAFEVGDGEEGERKGVAIQGRCAFYVGVSEWIIAQHKELEQPLRSPPWTWTQDPDDDDTTLSQGKPPVLGYFETARRAKEGGYVEGTWADEWVQYLNAHQDGKEEARQRASRTWLGWLTNGLNPFRVTTSFRTDEGSARLCDNEEDREAGERLTGLDDSAFEAGSPTGQDESKYFSAPPLRPAPDLRRRSSDSPELPRTVTSPKRHARNKPSFSFTSPPSSPTGRSSDERSGQGAERKASFLARVTGREKRRSEVEKAEEGEGPLSPRECIKRRKGGEEEPGEVV